MQMNFIMIILVVLPMDDAATTGEFPDMEYVNEVTTLFDEYAEADYIHINIPVGADAVKEYEKTISFLESLDVAKYDLPKDKAEFDYLIKELSVNLSYYKEIAAVYDKTDFVIGDKSTFESLEQDHDTIFSVYISSKEKYLLNKAIDLLDAKLGELGELETKFYGGLNGGC